MVFGLIAIRSWRLVLCEEETLGKAACAMFSQIKCTEISSVVEFSGCAIAGGEKGSGDVGYVKIAAVQEEAARRTIDELSGFALAAYVHTSPSHFQHPLLLPLLPPTPTSMQTSSPSSPSTAHTRYSSIRTPAPLHSSAAPCLPPALPSPQMCYASAAQ
ncbi:uncharacterized protein MONOS_7212 [Monocercomonoides exilis]|uniref:uncharacterized protein n=1 Tax=Monocercomonoides exilis TaxID=2049356 RepID=UPI00355A0993|nr:hypothetical protein MONOS_7212 [Monocercomonoides exilis]|eukprot:MONOS_7212.1-p1 / transcript=MONOS_7212.1 / gene=MONOS_7212 / organism=Monocercomonoides_exilis_PA203 / gene_product=unspecified product / transcript_product=unspecified product / location=Mono_scaffold00241:37928-38538(+) / protein_length=159 / sequence_SO=supercontig / SO=protein_coding / is_pseudo=false